LFALRWFLEGHVVCGCPVELYRCALPKSLVIFVSRLKFVNTGNKPGNIINFLTPKIIGTDPLKKDNHFVEHDVI